jgi:hypothetical protein
MALMSFARVKHWLVSWANGVGKMFRLMAYFENDFSKVPSFINHFVRAYQLF